MRLDNSENESFAKYEDIHDFVEQFDMLQEIELEELDDFVSDCSDEIPAYQLARPSLLIAITKKSMDDSAKKRKIDRIVIGARNCFSA